MKFSAFLLASCMSLCGVACAVNSKPPDVQRFVKNADMCVHAAGEWGSDLEKKEQEEIKLAIDRYCGTAKRQLDKLSIKCKSNAEIQKTLAQYDDSVKLYRKSQ